MEPISSGLRFGGLATGLDTAALIGALLDFERRPLGLIEQRRSRLESQQSVYRDLNTQLLAVRDAARALDNQNDSLSGATLDEELLAFTASSSDPTVATATASGNATAGTLSLRVLSLANVGRRISTTFASSTDPVASSGDTLSIDYGGEANIDITVGAGGASLADLKEAVNTDLDNGGSVRAEVLFDGTEYRLILSGVETGEENDITVTSSIVGGGGEPFVDATLTQLASDARLEMLGVAITRPTNEIDDVLPGVVVQVHSTTDAADPTDTVQLNVERDDEAIAGRLQTLVDAYNQVRDLISDQSQFDQTTGRAGPLSGDATLRGIDRQIQQIMGAGYNFDGNPLSFLGEIGLSFDREGRLVLDREDLTSALDESPLHVRQLLGGDGSVDGVATALARALEPITRSGDGSLAIRNKSFQDRIKGVDQQIERFETRLARREELLVRTYSRLESLVAGLQAQSNFLQSAF